MKHDILETSECSEKCALYEKKILQYKLENANNETITGLFNDAIDCKCWKSIL